MKTTRKKRKGLKKFCVYVWQEKKGKEINTYIDHIGDEEYKMILQLCKDIKDFENVKMENAKNEGKIFDPFIKSKAQTIEAIIYMLTPLTNKYEKRDN